MGKRMISCFAAGAMGLAALLTAVPAAAAGHIPLASATGRWTVASNGQGGSGNEPGVLRTPDGDLHLVWIKELPDLTRAYGYTTFSAAGKLLNSGTVLTGWSSLQSTPKLLPYGTGVRLVFNGIQNATANNPYSTNARFTATSPDGVSWTLAAGSLSSYGSFNESLAATTEVDGTPVTSEGINNTLDWHVGIDAAVPSTTADSQLVGPVGSATGNATLVRDSTGAVWLTWYQGFEAGQGYYAKQILPAVGASVKAPDSGNPAWGNNAPNQQVAAVARTKGGVYLAYCQATKLLNCADIALWRVGAAKATVVPGSKATTTKDVALSTSPAGRLVISWYDTAKNTIDVARTNDAVTKFAAVTAVASPPKTLVFDALAAESSLGPVDLMANVVQDATASPTDFWHRQVVPQLTLTAVSKSFSHTAAARLSFHVTDVGDPVAGATVSFDGKSAVTNANGVATIRLGKGVAKGSRAAKARAAGYAASSVTVTTT